MQNQHGPRRALRFAQLLRTDHATLHAAVASRAERLSAVSWSKALPILTPCALLIAGAAVGYPSTLDEPVARERLVGIIAASVLALAALFGLARLRSGTGLLVSISVLALLAGAWVIAASGSDVFRGTVGGALSAVFRPLFGRAEVTDSVAVANTRFIVGYNGLADLCLVAIFCCGAVLIERSRLRSKNADKQRDGWSRAVLLAIVAFSGLLLVGTGARGGLTGLAAGVCAVGLYAWPRRFALAALVAAPAALAMAAFGILDKGLEFSSTAGRLTYWSDLARLLVEYPLTGVGLGVDTAYQIDVQYEINPDPERVFYAHNTFVQSYLEQGPLGALGMLALPLVLVAAAIAARRRGVSNEPGQRALLIAGLGIVGGLEAHGLTDQGVTTNVGTAMVLVGLAAALAALSPSAAALVGRWTRLGVLVCGMVAALAVVGFVATSVGRSQALLDFGGLKMNAALAMPPQSEERAAALADADGVLSAALDQTPDHPAVLRDLARIKSLRFDDAAALQLVNRAASSTGLDAFDMLQIAHVYRDLGVTDEAYTWAARAYAAWGRPPEDAVMQVYAQSTLVDERSRVLAQQAEAAMRARSFGAAHSLFEQALTFEPDSAYLQDRIGAAQRAVTKYGPQG